MTETSSPVVTEDIAAQTRTRTYRNGYFQTYRWTLVEARGGYRLERRVMLEEGTRDGITAALAGSPAWVFTRDEDPDGAAIFCYLSRGEGLARIHEIPADR